MVSQTTKEGEKDKEKTKTDKDEKTTTPAEKRSVKSNKERVRDSLLACLDMFCSFSVVCHRFLVIPAVFDRVLLCARNE